MTTKGVWDVISDSLGRIPAIGLMGLAVVFINLLFLDRLADKLVPLAHDYLPVAAKFVDELEVFNDRLGAVEEFNETMQQQWNGIRTEVIALNQSVVALTSVVSNGLEEIPNKTMDALDTRFAETHKRLIEMGDIIEEGG